MDNNLPRKITLPILSLLMFLIMRANFAYTQGISENETRYIRIGELQSHFSAYGSERAWNNDYYEGLKWPAQYPFTDNSVIKRAWMAIEDFTDENGDLWDHWANYFYKGYAKLSLFPMELKQTARFETPAVYVDGENISAPYSKDVDTYNPDQIPDRIVNNIVNTSCGLTVTRRVLAFSQQYHDSYFIKEFIFTNTGNINADPTIELTDSIRGLRFGWGTRYSVCREGAANSDNQQSWGKHTWASRRGEDYKNHVDDVKNFTESTPFEDLEWIRCGFSWLGQSETIDYDMIGAPDIDGKGRLTAPQFAGSAVLHVDKGAHNKEGDPDQPVFLGWYAGDTYPSLGNLRQSDMNEMGEVYTMLSGDPYPSPSYGGSNRYYEEENNISSLTDQTDPYKKHGDGGGTNVMLTYGPFDLGHGDSVKIVEVEAVNGLSRTKCEEIGRIWKKKETPYSLPPNGMLPTMLNGKNYGETTDDKDLYKNAWVYTGLDSILLTFSRALRNYNSGYNIPEAPLPPPRFDVTSLGDRIALSWMPSPSETESNFAGYRVYRAVGRPDTVFTQIAELSKEVKQYNDMSAIRGFSYYYYLVSYTDGSENTTGIANPTGSLESGRFYTKTNKPAFLKRKPGVKFENVRIVPNPFNIKARDYNYTGEPNKIMFLDVPGYCDIRIFSERGDMIKKIVHEDGSGDEAWNSVTSSRQVIVSGVYIAHIEVTKEQRDPVTDEILFRKGDTTIRKFVVIR